MILIENTPSPPQPASIIAITDLIRIYLYSEVVTLIHWAYSSVLPLGPQQIAAPPTLMSMSDQS